MVYINIASITHIPLEVKLSLIYLYVIYTICL
jgi:hypothetical protein